MDFGSLDEYYVYLENYVNKKIPDIVEQIEDIFAGELQSQIFFRPENKYHRTGQMLKTPTAGLSGYTIIASYDDSGLRWTDFNGREVFPLDKWEKGGEVRKPGWRKDAPVYYPATNIMDEATLKSFETYNNEILEHLLKKGFKIVGK